MEQRTGDVTNAGASIIYYEQWKKTGDEQLLADIAAYNRDDVISTFRLHKWLCELRPEGMQWAPKESPKEGQEQIKVGEKNAVELRLEPFEAILLAGLDENEANWTEGQRHQVLTYQLLDFHRRKMKPSWWAYYERKEMTDAELIEDVECIGGVTLDPQVQREKVKLSYRYTYRFPAQETKLRGPKASDIFGDRQLSNLSVDVEQGRLSFTLGQKLDAPSTLALGPIFPVKQDVIVEAVFRYAESVCETVEGKPTRFKAIEDLLMRRLPSITGVVTGEPLVDEAADLLPQVIATVAGMQATTLFLQGPPGAGKTYTGSRVIVALLKAGKRVGVSSNSHHAINNLLRGVELAAKKEGIQFSGVKKSDAEKEETLINGDFITDVFKNEQVSGSGCQLLAGTAWVFSREELEQELDYLFVDEAGQVSLANVVGMGTAAKNIVLLGDQMQLGQPTQGVHPGSSGESVLNYLLDGLSTIPPSQGIFLNKTFRMHPDICSFISDAIYDGRLKSHETTVNQGLFFHGAIPKLLAHSGLRFVPVQHDGNAQDSVEEADVVRELYASLLGQHFHAGPGRLEPLTPADILVVAPYNMQVNLLRQYLPAEARVGTVDKFQGQEAQVVIISMATSNGDYLPRNIEFLFSKNRLNVAISRAKSLALLVASPGLMSIRCKAPEQMALVNTLCWVEDVSRRQVTVTA